MAGLDLSGLRTVVEAWIGDSDVEIVRDHGASDDELDEATGQLEAPAAELVYAGPGAVQPMSGFTSVPDPDVQRILATTDATYRMLLSLDAPADVRPGDLVRVTANRSTTPDPQLLARRFEVVELGSVSSFAVVRFIYLKQLGVAS